MQFNGRGYIAPTRARDEITPLISYIAHLQTGTLVTGGEYCCIWVKREKPINGLTLLVYNGGWVAMGPWEYDKPVIFENWHQLFLEAQPDDGPAYSGPEDEDNPPPPPPLLLPESSICHTPPPKPKRQKKQEPRRVREPPPVTYTHDSFAITNTAAAHDSNRILSFQRLRNRLEFEFESEQHGHHRLDLGRMPSPAEMDSYCAGNFFFRNNFRYYWDLFFSELSDKDRVDLVRHQLNQVEHLSEDAFDELSTLIGSKRNGVVKIAEG